MMAIGTTILEDPRWHEQGVELDVQGVLTSASIPLLQKPINDMSLMDLRSTIPQLMRADKGRQNIGWGREEMKPTWWPADVPFVNPNRQPDGFAGKLDFMVLVIELFWTKSS